MEEDNGVYRLEAPEPVKGGLQLPSKPKTTSNAPRPSILGLDKLAHKMRQENRLSFKVDDADESGVGGKREPASEHKFAMPSNPAAKRQYREPRLETPTYTGGVDQRAKEKAREREHRHGKGLHATSKEDRDRKRHKSSHSSRRSRKERDEDEPRTPRHRYTTSSWEEDDEPSGSSRKSSWDFPTPKNYEKRREEGSSRSTRRYYDDTPRATPAYK